MSALHLGTGPERGSVDPNDLLVYHNEDLSYRIACEIKPLLDRVLELRDLHGDLSRKDPEGTHLIISPEVNRQLESGRNGVSEFYRGREVRITNGQALESAEHEAQSKVNEINDIALIEEREAEHQELEKLVTDPELWTNAQTQEIAGRSLSYWNRLGRDTKFDYLSSYARQHPHVRGVQSETVLAYTAYPHWDEYNLKPTPLVKIEDIIGPQP